MTGLLDPKERSARGVALQERIYGQRPPEPQTPWEESVRDFVYAEVWSRPGLDLRARFLIGMAGAALCRFPQGTIDGIVRGALQTGELTLAEVREGALHLAVYGGWAAGDFIDKAATRAAEAIGLPPAKRPPIRGEPWDPVERAAKGEQEFIKAMLSPGGPGTNPFHEAINNFVFGEMWCREGLDQRSRRWMTLVAVAESGREIPIKSHFHAAMASGNCAPDEMKEFVLAYALCAGWPKGSAINGVVLEMIAKVEAGLPWNG